MLKKILEDIKCPVCDEGTLVYSNAATFASYADTDFFDINNMDKLMDSIVYQHISMTCLSCGYSERYTIHEIEKIVRENIMKKVISSYVMKELTSKFIPSDETTLIYCGDCRGFDGNGACPVSFYNNCGIRKL